MATSYLGKKQSFRINITFNRQQIAERIFEVIFEPEDSYIHYKKLWEDSRNKARLIREIADSLPNKVCQDFTDQVWEYIQYVESYAKPFSLPFSLKEFQNQWLMNWYFGTKSMKKTLENYIEAEFFKQILDRRPKYARQG